MNVKAPQNIHSEGPALFLYDHYKITLGRLGYAPSAVPDFLYFTFCGDLLGSSGEHYQKGEQISLHEAVAQASHTISDDFMESLAMSQMTEHAYDLSLESLMAARDDFYEYLKGHFESCAMTYSPWFRPLFDAQTEDAFFQVIASHSSCGAAMRAGVLGAMDIDLETMLPLMLLSHAHAGAVEGAYLIAGLIRHGLYNENVLFEDALAIGLEEGAQGRVAALAFLVGHGARQNKDPEYPGLLASVFESEDPYATIKDISVEGIETSFVVPAALYLVKQACCQEKSNGARHIVEESLRIGGDPDTICSIAMGVYGALHSEKAKEELSQLRLPQSRDKE